MTKGRISRGEYLARSLSRLKPWLAENISRRTWERRRLRDASPSRGDSANQDTVASPCADASEPAH